MCVRSCVCVKERERERERDRERGETERFSKRKITRFEKFWKM